MMMDYQPGQEFESILAITVFNWPILWLDVYGAGFSPYLWDKTARRTDYGGTQARLLGAHWERFNNQDVFVRIVPRWSGSFGAIKEIIDRINQEDLDFYLYTSGGQWVCELERYYVDDEESMIIKTADTAEFAVCLAAMELFG